MIPKGPFSSRERSRVADRAKLASVAVLRRRMLSLSFGARISALQVLSTISERTGGAVRTS